MDIALNMSTPSTATHLSPPTALGLDGWPLHTVAEVVGFASPQSDDQANTLLRLLEVGFLPGERVRLTACGLPGRDPLAVRVGQSTFALRRHEAALIQVAEPGTPGAAAEAAAPGGVPSGDRA
jgi:Fe2+ transport system protein FeoA